MKTFYKVNYCAWYPYVSVMTGEDFSESYIMIGGRRVKRRTKYQGIFDDFDTAKRSLLEYLKKKKEGVQKQIDEIDNAIQKIENVEA